MMGRQVSLVVTSSGHRKSFHEPMKPKMSTVKMGALLMGNTMRVRKRRWPEPSMRAASHNSQGICAKNWRSRKMLKTLTMYGTVIPCNVFSHEQPPLRVGMQKSPPRMTMKLGMMVTMAGIIMVLSSSANMSSRPKKRMRAKA